MFEYKLINNKLCRNNMEIIALILQPIKVESANNEKNCENCI